MHIASWTISIMLAAGPTVLAQNTDLHVVQTVAGAGYSGAPYSARGTAITARIADDGTRYSRTVNMRLWRDSAGRMREELWGKGPAGSDFHSVTVLDPVAGISLTWQVSDDPARSFVTMLPLPASQKIIEPVSSRFGLPPVNPPTAKAEPIPTGCTHCTVKIEYLASRLINGVHAVGVRTTRTYDVGTKENGRDFVAANTNETWTSPDLRINVLVINDQPEYGRTTLNVTDIVQGEPAPNLFQAPAGYQVRNGKGTMGQTAGTGAATTPTGSAVSAEPPVANALSGTWMNVDSGTGGLVKLIIDGLAVHPFGACHPNPCDWGTVKGRAFASSADSAGSTALTAEKVTTFSETTLTLVLEADGRLRVDDFTRFTDESYRANSHTLSYFKRESTEQPAVAQAAKMAPASPSIRKAAFGTSLAMLNADMLIPPAAYAVEGAPFEALIEETRTPLGSETTRRFVRVLRDGAGRQRYEDLVNADCKACKAAVASARVIDVVGQRSIHIDPVTRIAVSCTAPTTSQPVRMLVSTPEAQKNSNSGRLGRMPRKDESQGEVGEPQVAGLQVTLARASHEASTGHSADAQTPQAVNELWTSPLYRMPVKRVIEDPAYGHLDIEIVHFKPGEPDAALFQAPVGYVVRTEADDACGRARTSASTRE